MSDDLKIRWKGPKEWRPERWPISPLLSDEENRRISFIFRESKKTNSAVNPADVAWLCQTIRKLAVCAPDDYTFPRYMAFVHQIRAESFAMQYKESLLIEHTVNIGSPVQRIQLLDHWTSDRVCDSTVLIRPYIRIEAPADPDAVLLLRKSTLTMTVDHLQVLRTPIDEHLILSDRTFPRKNRWKVRGLSNILFSANLISEKDHFTEPESEGISCPHGSRIEVDLFSDLLTNQFGMLTLTTGLVAARYTTKSDDGGIQRPRQIQ